MTEDEYQELITTTRADIRRDYGEDVDEIGSDVLFDLAAGMLADFELHTYLKRRLQWETGRIPAEWDMIQFLAEAIIPR